MSAETKANEHRRRLLTPISDFAGAKERNEPRVDQKAQLITRMYR